MCDAFCTSTTGDAADTVTDSSSAPTFISALIVAVKSVGSSTLWRLTVWNPASVNVTMYTPGRRSTILYWPAPSVVDLAGLLDQHVARRFDGDARQHGAGRVFHDSGDRALCAAVAGAKSSPSRPDQDAASNRFSMSATNEVANVKGR